MLGLSPWLSLLAVLLAAGVARALPAHEARPVRRALNARWAPLVVGALAGGLSLWLWGSLTRTPVMHDESAYLLQAELFARFRWAGAGRPLPAFFEQLYVLVDGVLASKYPPGNSLLLAPGVLLGVPGLPVVLLNACGSALMFALAHRVAGGVVALLTWVVWQSSFPMMYYHANYMSEGATSVAWLMTWWGIVQWRDGAGRRWLVAAAAATAWCVITRPLTGVALGLVALAVVARRCRAERAWRDLVPAAALAALLLAIVPLWSWRTTGSAGVTPLASYTRVYVPFDKPGFGARDDERPSMRLPRDQWITSAAFYQEHARHTLTSLPAIAWQRLTMIDRDGWYEWRGGLRVCALIGLLALSIEGWVVVAAFAVQFMLYLSYAHPAWWTWYYVEGTPILGFVTALGIVRLFALVFWRGPVAERRSGSRAARLTKVVRGLRSFLASDKNAGDPRILVAVLLVAAAGLVAGGAVARQVRTKIQDDHAYYDAFAALIQHIDDPRAIVFVRYSAKHLDGISFVRNVPELDSAAVWTVYDRGAANARLLSLAPDRTPYLFDEESWTLKRLEPSTSARSRSIASVAPDSLKGPRGGRRLR
jgi:hypothetical protein